MNRRTVLLALTIVVILGTCLYSSPVAAMTEHGKRIVVSIDDQWAYFMEDGYLVNSHIVSTGADETPTPVGTFSITGRQYALFTGSVYQYYSMFYYANHLAFHSVLYSPSTGQWIGGDMLGHKASHGCIRQTLADAQWAYEWTPDGTRVDMIQEHFNPPPPAPRPAAGGSVVMGTGAPACEWYFAEGCTGAGFDEFIEVCNPGASATTVCLTLASPSAETKEAWLEVPGGTRKTVRVDDLLPDCAVVTTSLRSNHPVIAERSMYFDTGKGTLGGDATAGAKRPAARWLFAEGSCRPWMTSYICVFNPGSNKETARVTFMTGTGESKTVDLPVAASSRATLEVKNVLGEGDDAAHDFSCMVESADGSGLVVERPTYFAYDSGQGVFSGGDNTMGANAASPSWYFAEGTCRPGFDSFICIQNPGAADTVARVDLMLGNGGNVRREVKVPGRSRRTLKVDDVLGEGDDPAHDFSCNVRSADGAGLVAERIMYFNYQGGKARNWDGGHDAMGVPAPLPEWHFAEGTCRPSFDTYLCMLNPGDKAVGARVVLMTGAGREVERTFDIPGRTRRTLKVSDVLGEGNDEAHDFSCTVESTDGSGLVVERPMYFLFDRR